MARRYTEPCTMYARSRPRVGHEITYRNSMVGKVSSVEGGLCYVKNFDGSGTFPFIWCFRDGLNSLHTWPTKKAEHRRCGDPWTQAQLLDRDGAA